jgi:hypothetical protein
MRTYRHALAGNDVGHHRFCIVAHGEVSETDADDRLQRLVATAGAGDCLAREAVGGRLDPTGADVLDGRRLLLHAYWAHGEFVPASTRERHHEGFPPRIVGCLCRPLGSGTRQSAVCVVAALCSAAVTVAVRPPPVHPVM